jgi:hypothetical protein
MEAKNKQTKRGSKKTKDGTEFEKKIGNNSRRSRRERSNREGTLQ